MPKISLNNPRTVYLVMLLVPLFWGGAFGATKHVVTELPPLTAAAVRFLAAGLLMAACLFYQGGWNWHLVRRQWRGLMFLAVTGVFLYNAIFCIGMQYTSAINAALVIVINPVTTALVAVTFLGEAWNLRLGAGVLLSFIGVLTTITRGSLATLTSLSFNGGDLLLLGAVASWTAYTSAGKLVMREVPPLLATTVSTLAGAILLCFAAAYEGGWSKLPQLSGQTVAELVYMIVFATFIAFILFNVGVKRIGASKASAYINLMPVNAMWIAAVFYGETITLAHLAGVILIVSGVSLTTYFNNGQPAPKPAASCPR